MASLVGGKEGEKRMSNDDRGGNAPLAVVGPQSPSCALVVSGTKGAIGVATGWCEAACRALRRCRFNRGLREVETSRMVFEVESQPTLCCREASHSGRTRQQIHMSLSLTANSHHR